MTITDVRFDSWTEILLENNKCDNIEDLPLSAIEDEIDNFKDSIENEKLWEMGAETLDISDMHRDNIIAMQEYIAYLQELKSEKENHTPIDNAYNTNGKDIRFINSKYEDLFKIPDGGYIKITLNNGEQKIRKCAFIDETHTKVGNNLFHIREFAEKMEKFRNTYEPCPTPEKIAGYMITDRIPVRNKEFVLAHNPKSVDPYVTWVRNLDYSSGYELGHYWSKQTTALTDLFHRAEAERTDKPYDHTKLIRENKIRDVDAR